LVLKQITFILVSTSTEKRIYTCNAFYISLQVEQKYGKETAFLRKKAMPAYRVPSVSGGRSESGIASTSYNRIAGVLLEPPLT
jgi:hypothetical protein